jgi:uncharacterized protein DUF3303
MLFMVIERFEPKRAAEVYRRLGERGRGLPEGLEYVDSWVEAGFGRCFQLMRCDDERLLEQWMRSWEGSGIGFEEVVPVVTSAEAREAAASLPG